MDERTLNDLLECSVCLERLDTSSKVLPCQHTFCRKCLEVIVSSHQELRCPECRILVDAKIDDLPPNVLLMRILEGMKNQNNSNKSPRTNCNNVDVSNNIEKDNPNLKIYEQSNTVRVSNNQNSNKRIVPHAFALYDFISSDAGDLNFKKGDIILLKRKLDSNWFYGEINGREGSFPINYVQVIVPLPVPQCIALYDFKMGPNEEEGCLTFKKGTIINVLRKVDHNWAEGRIGTSIGIFPIAFVEMNPLAKQLLEIGKTPTVAAPRCLPPIPFENSSSDSSTTPTTSPNSSSSSNTSTNSIPSSPTTNCSSAQNQTSVNHRDLKEKRHSLNALTSNTALSVVQSNRHSAEILSVSEPTDSNTYESIQTMSASPSLHPQTQSQAQEAQSTMQQTCRANVLKTTNQITPALPWAYVALYPYKPRKSDELELKKGGIYFVTERCLDGWYKGKNWAEKSGVFPGNFVAPLKSKDQQKLIHQRVFKQNPSQTSTVTSNVQIPLSQNQSAYTNTVIHLPPELPPRSNVNIPGLIWTKPLGQHVEAFFTRKCSSGQSKENKTSHINNAGSKNLNIILTNSNKEEIHQSQSIKEKEKKESASSSAVSLMKRLTNIKRSKSPTHNNAPIYSMDNPVFDDGCTSPVPSSSKQNISMTHPVHVRSGSCPSQLLQSLPIDLGGPSTSSADISTSAFGSQRVKGHKERPQMQGMRQQVECNRIRTHLEANENNCGSVTNTSHSNVNHKQVQQIQQVQQINASNNFSNHRKTQSLDSNVISSQITGNSPNGKNHSSSNRERFRCIVSYPPNSEMELELNVGDIVFVHRKLKNGWYKGTHARTNKIGLFPASFVEPDI